MHTPTPVVLTSAQRGAVAHVTATAGRRRSSALTRLADAEPGIGVAMGQGVDQLVRAVREHGRVTLNFHPDRLVANGQTVAEALAVDGRYRGQFETGISNGSRTAFAGGDRDRWEERLFGRAYHAIDVVGADRPKYGALNLVNHSDGGSPRFGSCHLRLRPEVNERCTFTVGDSHLGPTDIGTLDAFESVLAGLVERATTTGVTLGAVGVDPIALLAGLPERAVEASPAAEPGRSLDDYIEAQVHGPIDLATHAEALVLDPSFRGTRTGDLLEGLARGCGIAVEWHAGFALRPDEVDPEFRGPEIPPLAVAMCAAHGCDTFDAEVVGRLAASVMRDPAAWRSWGTRDEVLQFVKYLWHTLVQFGHSRGGTGR